MHNRNIRTAFTSLVLVLFACLGLSAQQQGWTLEDCLAHAMNNSRQLVQAQLQVERQEIGEQRLRRSREPLASVESQSGWQFGRNIDPTTNTFNSDAILFNSASIRANWTVYQGGRIQYALERQRALLQAAQADVDQVRFQLRLEVTNAYLNILLAKEHLARLQAARALTQEQLDRVERDITIGVRPEKDRLNMQAQLAAEDQQITDAQYRLEQSYRDLKRLLRMAPEAPLEVATPSDTDWNQSLLGELAPEQSMEEAIQSFPAYRAAVARWNAGQKQTELLQAERWPSIVLFGSLGTQFSSAARQLNGYEYAQIDQQVWLEGEPTTLSVIQPVPSYGRNPYFRQVQENFGQAIGLQVRWTIWDQGANRLAREEARIQNLEASLAIKEQEEWFRYEVDRAQNYLQASQASYHAAQLSAEAAEGAYQMARESFAAGGLSAYELLEAKKRHDAAQNEWLQARYDCLFAHKILSSLYP